MKLQIECFWECPEKFEKYDHRMRKLVSEEFPNVKLRCFTFYTISCWAYKVIYDYEIAAVPMKEALHHLYLIINSFPQNTLRCSVYY